MQDCKALIGKTISGFSLFDSGTAGPEIQIEFTDGTVFHSRMSAKPILEAQLLKNYPGRSELLKDFTS